MNKQSLVEAYVTRARLLDAINKASPWHLLHRTLTKEHLSTLVPSGKVLDLAAGTGLMSRHLVERGCKVTMVDALEEMCHLALDAVPIEHKNNVEVICSDACTFRYAASEVFDTVICTQALNFVEETQPFFKTAWQALKPGGVFYLDVDNYFRWIVIEALAGHFTNVRSIVDSGIDVEKNIVGAEYYFHSLDTLVSNAENAGFSLERTFGLLFATPFLHLFSPSIDFLQPEKLPASVQKLLEPSSLSELLDVERHLSEVLPIEMAGYQVLILRK